MMAATAQSEGKIARGIRALYRPGEVFEVRILEMPRANGRTATYVGYFDNPDKAAAEIAGYDGKAKNIYISLNAPNPALLARANNRLIESLSGTKATEIVRRKHLLFDFDPVRPSGVSATNAEHDAALKVAQECHFFLTEKGWPEPLSADSGNGAHLVYCLDLPNEDDSTTLIAGVLDAVALHFDDNEVKVDTDVKDAPRITKLYGTMACKGDQLPDRPHRRSTILSEPDDQQIVEKRLLEEMVASVPKDPTLNAESNGATKRGHLDISRLLEEHNIGYKKGEWKGKPRWVLDECPFDHTHKRSACIVQFPGGGLSFSCRHKSCSGQDWQAFKAKLGINVADTSTPGQPRAFRLLTDEDLDSLQPPTYLIDSTLVAGSLAALVGAPGHYKTFLALDWALSVATGCAWNGKKAAPGLVVYILSLIHI